MRNQMLLLTIVLVLVLLNFFKSSIFPGVADSDRVDQFVLTDKQVEDLIVLSTLQNQFSDIGQVDLFRVKPKVTDSHAEPEIEQLPDIQPAEIKDTSVKIEKPEQAEGPVMEKDKPVVLEKNVMQAGLRLKGTIQTRNGSSALIEYQGTVGVYRVGDVIIGTQKIVAIGSNVVEVE